MATVTNTGKVKSDGEMLVVDLGKKKKKQIKQLRNGTGKLVEDVKNCIQELQTAGSLPTSAQPVIVIVREKISRPRLPIPW